MIDCKLSVVAVLFSVCALGACSSTGSSKKAPPMSEQEMMAKWTAYGTPGPEHKLLADKVGKWNFTASFWEAPGKPPEKSTGTSEVRSVMGGRYFVDETHGTMMGQPFEGLGITGYDNLRKKYVGSWIDNMGTGLSMSEGTYDASRKVTTYKTEMPDMATGKYMPMRMVERKDSVDQYTAEFYFTGPDGKEFKNMEFVYKRAK